jgi:hypothetical protein
MVKKGSLLSVCVCLPQCFLLVVYDSAQLSAFSVFVRMCQCVSACVCVSPRVSSVCQCVPMCAHVCPLLCVVCVRPRVSYVCSCVLMCVFCVSYVCLLCVLCVVHAILQAPLTSGTSSWSRVWTTQPRCAFGCPPSPPTWSTCWRRTATWLLWSGPRRLMVGCQRGVCWCAWVVSVLFVGALGLSACDVFPPST